MGEPERIARFLMEAWQDLVGMEEAVAGIGGADPEEASRALIGLASCLGSAADDFGFPRLQHLADSLVRLARELPPSDHPSLADVRQLLGESLTVLPMVLENIATEGSEDIPQLAGLQWRTDAEVAAAEERAEAEAGLPGEVDLALQTFREEDPEALGFFLPEAREHLRGMARCLGSLKQDAGNAGQLQSFFRHVHTLKGAAFTVGCEPIGQVAHWLEDLLAPIREMGNPLDHDSAAAVAMARGHLHQMVERLDGVTGPSLQPQYEHLQETFASLLRRASDAATRNAVTDDPIPLEPRWRLSEAEARTPLPLDGLWNDFVHEVVEGEGSSFSTATAAVAASAPEGAAQQVDSLGEVGGTQRFGLRADFTRVDPLFDRQEELERISHRFGHRLEALRGLLEHLEISQRKARELAHGLTQDPPGAHPGKEDAEQRAGRPEAIVVELAEELARELATLRGDLRSSVRGLSGERRQLAGASQRLRVGLSQARQVPLSSIVSRFERRVRDVAEASGKQARLEVLGGKVELDYDVLEGVVEPLIHLLTNAVHHGIETPQVRRARSKDAVGNVRLEATRRGQQIRLEVADDGQGIDLEALRRAAQANGWLRSEVDDRPDALELICHPGLTTAEAATTTVGRGVGMDAVRHAVQHLGGELSLESEPEKGARFRLVLPISRLRLGVLRLWVGSAELLVPASAVERVHGISGDRLESDDTGNTFLRVGQERLRLRHASQQLGLAVEEESALSPGAAGGGGVLGTAVEIRGRQMPSGLGAKATASPGRRALQVDRVDGPEEILTKDVGPLLSASPLYLGAAIDRDGRVLPVLDPALLFELASADEIPRANYLGKAAR